MSTSSIAGSDEESVALDQSGESAAALRRACKSLQKARDQGEPAAVAAALVGVARVRFRLGQYGVAKALAREALALAAPDAPTCADAWQVMANCAAETDSLAEAETFFRRAADLARENGYLRGRMAALHGLAAAVYIPRGLFDLALAAAEEGRSIALKQDRQQWLIYPLAIIAMACQLAARPDCARGALDELRPLVSPGSIIQGYHLAISASLALNEGDGETARELFGQTRSIAEATGEPWLNVAVRLGMSRYHCLAGNFPDARAWADDALVFAIHIGYRHEQGKALIERGRAAWLCDDLVAAEADLRAAIEILDDLGAAFDLIRARFLLVALLHQQRRVEAPAAWRDAGRGIVGGGYAFLLEQERALAFPLLAAYLNSPDPTLASVSATLVKHLQRVPPEPLRVVMLGRFEVWRGRQCINRSSLRQRRAGELLALLLLNAARRLSLDQVIEALWPDKSPTAAQTAFHHATSAVRRALEPDLPDRFPSRYLEVEEGQISLCLTPGSSIDYETFEAHCQQGRWEEALLAYGGDLLPDHRYADWAFALRERLMLKYQRALLGAAEARLAAGRLQEALDACHSLLALEPWHEQVVLVAMRASVALNDRAQALRLYHSLEQALRRDLDALPSSELRALYHSLTPRASE